MAKRSWRYILALIVLGLVAHKSAQGQGRAGAADFHSWAPTPPLGWNSWDCYGPTVTEAEVKANADYMAKHLKPFGWEYIVVDIRWYVANDKAHGYNETDPIFSLDGYGRYLPAENRFPSSAGGKGFKPLADYLHKKGLKLGLHMMRGVPVQAVERKLPVLGTNVTAAAIYSKEHQAGWLHDNYTVQPTPEGQAYYTSIFKLYAAWGVDFVKVDDLSSPYYTEEIEMIRKAVDGCGRKIVLSTSPGETPIEKAQHVRAHANMWRTVGDFWDSWDQLKEHFEVCARWAPQGIPGAYPDADMLPLGHIGIRAERGEDRQSRFTRDEARTLMTLWAMARSPLMFGGDLPGTDNFTLSLLTNREVLHLLNHSRKNHQVSRDKDRIVWTAEDAQTGDLYLALFNAQDQELAGDEEAAWAGKRITRDTPSQSENFEIDITGERKLFLNVLNGGDDIAWDHVDWIAPTLSGPAGTLLLTTLPWRRADAGWGQVSVDKSVSGGPLVVAGTAYTNGIGTHANSMIEYDLPVGYTRFKARVGLDQAGAMQNTGGTFSYRVFTQNPYKPAPADSVQVPVDLTALGVTGPCVLTDLWTGKVVEGVSGAYAPFVSRHGAKLYRITRKTGKK